MNDFLDLQLIDVQGQGKPFVVLWERELVYQEYAKLVVENLALRSRVFSCASSAASKLNWKSLSEKLVSLIQNQGLRQASFVGFGAASTIVLNLALTQPRLIRNLVLVDATCRPHPDSRTRALDRIEKLLPFGLPFRISGEDFDGASYLHCVRAPTLLLNTKLANEFVIEQSQFLWRGLPSAWCLNFASSDPSSNLEDRAVDAKDQDSEIVWLARTVLNFESVPLKCPQRSSSAA